MNVRVDLADVVKVAVGHLPLLGRLGLLVLHHMQMEARLEPVEPPPREGVDGRVSADAHEPREVACVLGVGGRRLERAVVYSTRCCRRFLLRPLALPAARLRLPHTHDSRPHLEDIPRLSSSVSPLWLLKGVVVGRSVGRLHLPPRAAPPLAELDWLPVHLSESNGSPQLRTDSRDLLIVELSLLLGHRLPEHLGGRMGRRAGELGTARA
mmetsp:Transcript_29482/g.90379  ORF Transcript_29482/g.90379 Transcript_29482/m.90379 type:complete len:210 (-) Transcript_29482:67-696(-)